MHLWDCDPSNGPTSRARCRRCGETREFVNALTDVDVAEMAQRRRFAGQAEAKRRKEADMGKIKGSTGAVRARELARTKARYFEMVAEGHSEDEIAAMIAEAADGPPSSTTLRKWRRKAVRMRSSHIVKVDVPVPDAPDVADVPVPGSTGSARRTVADWQVWDALMAMRPEWSEKVRLAAWLEAADKLYHFLEKTGHA